MNAVIASPSQSDQKLLYWLAVIQYLCLAGVGLISGVVLCAWFVPSIGAAMPDGWSLMKANTALGFLLNTVILMLITGRRSRLGRIGAVIVVFIACAALLGSLSGRTIWVETLLAPDAGAEAPGRMSTPTAVFLAVMGSTLACVGWKYGLMRRALTAMVIVLLVVTVVVIAGYIFDAVRLFGHSMHTRTSPQTLACMILSVFTITAYLARSGLFPVLVGVGVGSRVVRILSPLVLLLPFVIVGVSGSAVLLGWLSQPYAEALTVSVFSVLLFVFVVLMGRKINSLTQELHDLSYVDELTKVYNCRAFQMLGEQALQEARRAEGPLTVLFFDLDGLKGVNDIMGHEVGSRLLQDFTGLLRDNCRASDIVARLGGDEFAIVSRSAQGQLVSMLRRLDSAIEGLNRTGGRPYRINYSVGEAVTGLGSAESFVELVDRADAAMYLHKSLKRAAREDAGAVQ
jgi:diguanylate cyclase (GGDEF)-like protein